MMLLITKYLQRIVISAMVMFYAPAVTAASAEPSHAEPFKLGGSEIQTIHSKTLGRAYDLYIKLPSGYKSEKNAKRNYPVIYFNDGGYCWVTAVGVTRAPFNHGGYEKAILVGLSYAKGENGVKSRTRDLTPTKIPGANRETGGADAYLGFVKDEVIPFVERHYRADSQRRMLVGQSFGGLFGVYTLLEEPGLFQDYVLTSPSLWHDNKAIFELEEKALKDGKKLSGRVYFAVGETETPAINGGSQDMVGQQTVFAQRLRSRDYPGLIIRDEVLEGGTHLTTYPIGLTRALRWLIPGADPFGG